MPDDDFNLPPAPDEADAELGMSAEELFTADLEPAWYGKLLAQGWKAVPVVNPDDTRSHWLATKVLRQRKRILLEIYRFDDVVDVKTCVRYRAPGGFWTYHTFSAEDDEDAYRAVQALDHHLEPW